MVEASGWPHNTSGGRPLAKRSPLASALGFTHDRHRISWELDRFKTGHSLCDAQPKLLPLGRLGGAFVTKPESQLLACQEAVLCLRVHTSCHLDLGIGARPSPRWPWCLVQRRLQQVLAGQLH